ncbi:MAG: SufS family cysteine desulfurase [Actinobacteria bacterium]|nr:SufS family cysteine desulfurase [Actinomycetota bacterium]
MTAPGTAVELSSLDVTSIKADFTILERKIHGKPVVYLDSAASAQKPESVLEAMDTFARTSYANVHRGVYTIAEEATDAYESARRSVARFIGAPDAREVIFTRNATESINLVAFTWGRANLGPGDVVVSTEMEHHANIVPWQMLAAEKGFELRFIPVDADGRLEVANLGRLLDGAKMLTVTHESNVLATINDVPELAAAAHAAGAICLVDACQSVPHMPVDVTDLGADFVVFSGHKMLGPTGIGVLWGRSDLLDAMPPFMGGGEMIADVRLDGFSVNELPWKFEAGTMPIIEAVGLEAAIGVLESYGMDRVRAHEVELNRYALATLGDRFGDKLKIWGPSDAEERGGLASFSFDDIHPHDISQVLDEHGVCVRAGHHCAKPLMRCLGIGATARASWYVYNTTDDIDALADALAATEKFFSI